MERDNGAGIEPVPQELVDQLPLHQQLRRSGKHGKPTDDFKLCPHVDDTVDRRGESILSRQCTEDYVWTQLYIYIFYLFFSTDFHMPLLESNSGLPAWQTSTHYFI